MREQWPLRRTLLIGLGAVGASALMRWTAPVRADDRPKATPVPTEPHVAAAGTAQPQRATLFEEDPSEPKGRQFAGSALWSAVRENAEGPERPANEMVLRAKIAIPDRGMTLEFAMWRDTDKLVWASHTIHLVFSLPPAYAHGGIQSVPGMLMKTDQYARGVPVAGTAVKVKGGQFLIGLSAVEAERQRNLALLKDGAWLDIPIVYTDGRRAILAIEKGPPGERALGEALAAWE
jgi:hypothetical protein